MPIVAYTGLPRSGKSYGVVENVIIPSLKAGRHIITNIPLKLGRFADDYPDGRITYFPTNEPFDEKWQEYTEWVDERGRKKKELVSNFWDLDKHPHGAVWVIDEVWRYWKSGTKANQIIEREMQFFTEHGHCVGEDGYTNEIILVTQDLAQVASCVRSLVEETFRAVKLTAIGQKNKYRVDVYQGAVTGQKPGTPMRQLFGTYKPEIYQYYKSHTHNKTDFAAGMEEKADDRANILKSPFFRFGLPAAVLVIGYSLYSVLSYFDRGEQEEQPQATQEAQPLQSAQAQPVRREARQEKPRAQYNERQARFEIEPDWLPLSDRWRIVGEVNGVYWIWGETGTRKVHSRICAKTQKTGEPYCVIDGKLVTYYSFREPVREEHARESRSYFADKAGMATHERSDAPPFQPQHRVHTRNLSSMP